MAPRWLALIRHGEAEAFAASDSDRALTARGLAQAKETGRKLAEWITDSKVESVRLVNSPYLRAQQTAQCVGQAIQRASSATSTELTPDSSADTALSWLEAQCESQMEGGLLVVVSHMPLMALLDSLAVNANTISARGFHTGECRILAFDDNPIAAGCASPVSCIIPEAR